MAYNRRPLFKAPPGFDSPPVPFIVPPGQVVRIADLRKFAPRGSARRTGLGGLGGPAADRHAAGWFPTPQGTPGNSVFPYTEDDGVWGGQQGDAITAPIDPSAPVGPLPTPALGPSADGLSVPFGQSFTPWANPTTFQSVPILASTPSNAPVLSLNLQRNALVIQNGSTATAPDTAPIIYVGFNAQAIVGFSLAVYPNGGAVVFDIICPRDSIFIAFGPFVNGGATAVLRGMVIQGTKVATS